MISFFKNGILMHVGSLKWDIPILLSSPKRGDTSGNPFNLELTGREHLIPESLTSKLFQEEKGLVLNVELQV
jgi:hypothetical protein